MRKIKITVAPPVLDTVLASNPELKDTYGLKFFATSYRILNRIDGLDDQDALVAESWKDTQNLQEKIFNINFPEHEFLYVTTKHHFQVTVGKDKGKELETEWGGIVPISKYDNRLKVSDVIVSTPSIFYTENNGVVSIETGKYNLYAGPGKQCATSYRVEDTNNNVIFERNLDEDNLTSITTPVPFEKGKLYLIKASHHSTTGGNSNYGSEFFNNYSADSNQFELECSNDFINNRKLHYKIKLWSTGFMYYKLELVERATNKVVQKLEKEKRLAHYILHSYKDNNPEYLQIYDFYLTVTFKVDNKTINSPRTLVHSDTMGINTLYPYNTYTKYIEKFDKSNPVITSGITCSTFRELFDGGFIGVDFASNKLYIYKNNNGTLVKYKPVYTFPNKIDLSYVNIWQIYNGNILVDAAEFDNNNQTSAAFYIFEYNTYREELELIKKVTRVDEKYSTSMSNSLACTGNGECWYVPAYLTTGKDSDRVPLRLRRLDLKTYQIDRDIELPFVAKYNVSLFADKDSGIYIMGGSAIPRYVREKEATLDETLSQETYYEMDNRVIYKLIRVEDPKKQDYLEQWTVIPDDIPKEAYCWHPFLRIDGNIVMFNATSSGSAVGYNKFMVLEPYTKTIEVRKMNGYTNIPFRSNVVFLSGNILRISSTIQKEQQAIMYISNTKATELVKDIDMDYENTDALVVGDQEVVVIEDLYKYKNIKITGGGILKWIRPQGITILTSKDLIVNKDRNMQLKSFNSNNWRSILILDGVQANFL